MEWDNVPERFMWLYTSSRMWRQLASLIISQRSTLSCDSPDPTFVKRTQVSSKNSFHYTISLYRQVFFKIVSSILLSYYYRISELFHNLLKDLLPILFIILLHDMRYFLLLEITDVKVDDIHTMSHLNDTPKN